MRRHCDRWWMSVCLKLDIFSRNTTNIFVEKIISYHNIIAVFVFCSNLSKTWPNNIILSSFNSYTVPGPTVSGQLKPFAIAKKLQYHVIVQTHHYWAAQQGSISWSLVSLVCIFEWPLRLLQVSVVLIWSRCQRPHWGPGREERTVSSPALPEPMDAQMLTQSSCTTAAGVIFRRVTATPVDADGRTSILNYSGVWDSKQ